MKSPPSGQEPQQDLFQGAAEPRFAPKCHCEDRRKRRAGGKRKGKQDQEHLLSFGKGQESAN
jgi:hypothetical protein